MEKIELQEGQKPVQGVPSGFGRGTTIYTTDESGRITQAITSGAPLDTANVVPVSVYENPARVGDYYYDTTGRLQVWKNSPTDFIQRYKIAVGGTAAPANTVSIANEGVGAVNGASIGSLVGLLGGPVGAGVGVAIGALAGSLTAHNQAASNALKAWQNEDVKYDSAVDFYKDENGNIKYKLDYSKMGVGGVRSGEGIKEAQNRETSVSLGADGRLKVTTNPIFAATPRYQELINWISENYAGLNKNTENLDEILTEIKNGIDGEAQSFITNMRLYADYANRFSADPDIIVASYMTEIAGYVKPDQMKDYDVAIIGDNGGIETKSSEELFNSVHDMSADDKNRLLEKLTNIAYENDGDYSENEKSIAYGELQALYAVSANTEKYEDDKYQGMLDADPFITFLSNFSPLGLNAADVANFVSGGNAIQTKQEYLNQNDFAIFAGVAGGALAGLGVFKAGTSLIEKGMKLLPGTKQLFQASLEGQTGGALAGYAKLQGSSGALLKASAASAAFKTLKIGTFDAILAGATSLTSKKDFWTEFGRDFARDATLEIVFSYFDMVKFQHAVTDNMVQAVVNPETGNIEVLPTTEKVYTDDGIEMQQVATGGTVVTPAGEEIGYADVNGTKVFYRNGQIMTVSPTGEVVNDAPINGVPALKTGVNVQSDPATDIATALTKAGYPADTNVIELSSKSLDSAVAAGKFAKWDTSKAGLAINKALFNKNAALDAVNNMALAKTGDRNAWQNAQEYFVSVWDNAEREITNISNGTYYPEAVKAFDDYTSQFGQLNLAQKYTKKDANYLKAIIQLERAQYLNDTRIPGDERDYVAEAMEKYSEALAIPEDRAQALQQFSEVRKARHDATKESALRSGWVDAKRLANVMESDIQKEIGWVPMWGKKQTYNGLLNTFYGITPERNPQKRWLNKGEWVDLDVLEDPLTADERFLSFVGTNMGINAMKDVAVDVLGKAGLLLDETPVQEHSNLLSSVKNADELEKKFNELVDKKRKEIEKKVPSEKQYANKMEKLVKDSGVLEALDNTITSLSPQPGGIREELNAQVPGADVLEWGLLSREHTNGLIQGGLYAGISNPVKAYIMNVDDLAKLNGYNLDEADPEMGKLITMNVNVEGAIPMLPVHMNNSGDAWMKMRWGHNRDGYNNWAGYLKMLKDSGVEKVPVAIEKVDEDKSAVQKLISTKIPQKNLDSILKKIDTSVAKYTKLKITPREVSAASRVPGYNLDRLYSKIRNSIPQELLSEEEWEDIAAKGSKYDWDNDAELNKLTKPASIAKIVKEKLGHSPQDITTKVRQAFEENGRIPFFRGQEGLGQFNMNNQSPSTQVGDAYWIAPNSSYTDTYGSDKIMGTIPTKYFMSDKEKVELVKKLREELLSLDRGVLQETGEKYLALKKELMPNELNASASNFLYFLKDNGAPDKRKKAAETIATMRYINDKPIDSSVASLLPKTKFWKDLQRAAKLKEIVDDTPYEPMSGNFADMITSYRALAEYAGKPVIDISKDGFADGTAFFYYEGVSPEFDKEVGEQLSTQAAGTSTWTEEQIEDVQKKLEETYTLETFMDKAIEKNPGLAPLKQAVIDAQSKTFDRSSEAPASPVEDAMRGFYHAAAITTPVIARVIEDAGYQLHANPNETISDVTYSDLMGHREFYKAIWVTLFDELGIENPNKISQADAAAWEGISPRSKRAAIVLPEDYLSDLTTKTRTLLDKAAEYNNQFGYEFDVESYMNTSVIPNLTEAVNKRDRNLGAAIINQAVLDVAPYQSREALLSSQQEEVAKEWRVWAEKNIQTDGDKKRAVDLVAAKINGETTDAYEMGAATTASGMGGRYPITWFKNGKPYTRFIKYDTPEQQRLAEEITHLFEDKQLIKNPGIIDRTARAFANNFRLLTTALDVTRAPLNFVRDNVRGEITSSGESFINPGELFKSVLELGDYTPEQKQKLSDALDEVSRKVAGETYNKAYRDKRKSQVAITKEYLSKSGANPLKRFIYNVKHDKMSLLEKPADFFEGLTRRRLAKSAATVALRKAQMEGKSFDEQMKILYSSATFAGREYTANFSRKGTLIGATSRYVAYQSSAYAGIDGIKRAFINNPQGVARNFATFLVCYIILLADTLADEESRKNYYRLSDYDRGNSIIISLGDNTVLTIPLDQEVASFLFPYRRFVETLNGTDPVSFFELMWGTFTEPMPFDMSGFSEGGSFNLKRGLEKLTAQNIPSGLTPIQEAASGYDLYYGSDLEVTDETLKDYGIYDPQAGDYTTAGNNSQLLRNIANATGIPQWQLQVMVSGYGGNVGQYVLNIIDKLSGASEEAQGGKDFANAIFKSFVATDQDNANNVFYDGIQKLKQEKNKVVQTIANYNDQLATATGEAKVEIQNKIQKAKDDYATKVGDFVDQYISAYEITGGLPRNQALQVYYLFRFDDDDTVYQSGSVEEYYNNQATQQFKNDAARLSAPILDRYYNNRIGNIYQDSDGTWRHYLSSGAQAMKNRVYGAAEQQKVDLLNILEGKNSLKNLRNQIKEARSQAFDAKNYDIADKLGYELDRRVVARIKPYIDQYGAENVLGNSEVLDYLSDWFIVPDSFIRTKRGGYVSLANNASSQEAFVRPFIKYIFGLPTNYYSYSDTNLTAPSL